MSRFDDFNRSGSTLGTPSDGGSPWSVIGSASWSTNGSVAACGSGSGQCLAVLNTGISADQWVSVKVYGAIDAYYGTGVILRCDGTDQNYVMAEFIGSGGGGANISYTVGGSSTGIDNASFSIANGDTILLTAVGTTFNVYQNGTLVLGPYTLPGAPATGAYCGIAAQMNVGGATFDDFLVTPPGGGSTSVNAAAVSAAGAVGAVSESTIPSFVGGDSVISAFYSIPKSGTSIPLLFRLMNAAVPSQGMTGLTPTVTICKLGGSFNPPAGAVSEIGVGWYKVAGNATDTNTSGPLLLYATGSGAISVSYIYLIGTALSNVTEVNSNAATLDTDKTGYSLAANGLDAVRTTLVSGLATNFTDRLNHVWSRFWCRSVKDPVAHTEKFYDVDSTTVLATQPWTDDGAGSQTISKGA